MYESLRSFHPLPARLYGYTLSQQLLLQLRKHLLPVRWQLPRRAGCHAKLPAAGRWRLLAGLRCNIYDAKIHMKMTSTVRKNAIHAYRQSVVYCRQGSSGQHTASATISRLLKKLVQALTCATTHARSSRLMLLPLPAAAGPMLRDEPPPGASLTYANILASI